jgi:hypothetical protein
VPDSDVDNLKNGRYSLSIYFLDIYFDIRTSVSKYLTFVYKRSWHDFQ